MMRWRALVERWLGRQRRPAPPPEREHMPELHALRNRRTVQQARTDLLTVELERLRADARLDAWVHEHD